MPDHALMTPRILIVDDEPRNIRLIEGMLYGEPYQVVSARSGQEALEIIAIHEPDLVLLDVMMPGISGFEVCQQIKSHPQHRHIPVVMVTALNQVSDRVEAMQVGADDFLSKPVDATELLVRVRSLMRVRQLNIELERVTAERLRFMAGIAHDIRSPLNALSLSLEMLQDKEKELPLLGRLLPRMMTCVEQIQMLASGVMNYYRIEAGNFTLNITETSVVDILEAVRSVAAPIAEEKNITLLIPPPPPLTLYADRSIVIQVLLNLLTNGIKYTAAGGKVQLAVFDLCTGAYELPPSHYPPLLMLPTSGLVFEVRDNGYGIAPEHFARVFSEFDRLNAEERQDKDGVGLGLPVARRLIHLHGGEIWFESTAGVGTTFAFWVPLQAVSPLPPSS